MEYKHEIKWGDPLELKPYENNPRVNDYAVKKVLASIEEFGFTSPILVDPDLVIIAGHTRREAVKSLSSFISMKNPTEIRRKNRAAAERGFKITN